MLTAIKIVTATWFTPSGEEGKETPTRYRLRGLTGIEVLEVFEGYKATPDGGAIVTASAYKSALKLGLVGWENFRDEKGDVAFSRNQEDNVARLDFKIIRELYGEIMLRTELPEDETKKS